jgi:tetratricopeptide (TPR) repeat protein
MKIQVPIVSLALAMALASSACTTASFGHRERNTDPDERLDALVSAYQDSRGGKDTNDSHLLVDAERSAAELEQLALEFPRHVRTLQANAVIAYDNHDHAKTQRYLAALFAVEPSYPEAAILRSRVAIDEGNLPLARRQLEAQVDYTPNHAGVREALSSVLYMSGDLDGAARSIAVAEKLGAPAWRVAFNRGLLAEAAGRPADAQRFYRAALDANPEFEPAKARMEGAKAGS